MGFPESLSGWLAEHLGAPVRRSSAVAGGCIHRAWCVDLDDGRRLFAKTSGQDGLPLMEAEAEGLRALACHAGEDLVIPHPLLCGIGGDWAVLVLPWLDLSRGSHQPFRWRRLGASLAHLHRQSLLGGDDLRFGWAQDNFIGSGPQLNGWSDTWGRFFAEQRLEPQLRRLERRDGTIHGADALLDLVPGWLDGHGAEPALVHGDLWAGNAGLTEGERGALFDPAVYRGDREVDLAMARLFGGFPETFFRGYEEIWPLPSGHEHRIPLYNLYHLLNHANLFAGGYGDQARSSVRELLQDPPD